METAEMGHVEDADTFPHRAMLGEHRGVLHRHLPTAEVDESGAEALVEFV
jgi:hypothetical protein